MPPRLDLASLVKRLEQFADQLPAIVNGTSDDDARWRPASGDWSILEIVGHLVDEERWDFRRRLRLVLDDPQAAWPAIDPPQWALDHNYNAQSLGEQLEEFGQLRRESIRWLRSLADVDWHRAHADPKLGDIRAGDLLSAWCAHDRLHLRQIAKRQFELVQRDAGPFRTNYAGQWTT